MNTRLFSVICRFAALLMVAAALGVSGGAAAAPAFLPGPGGPFDATGTFGGATGGELALAALRQMTAPPGEGEPSAGRLAEIPPLLVPFYSQRDPRWGCERLGTCTCDLSTCRSETFTTLADAGCYPTSQAMLFAYYAGGEFMDPSAYNACLTANAGYIPFPGACADGVCGAMDDPPAACRPEGLVYVGPSLDKAVLDQDLRSGYPAIGVVDVGVPGRSPHAVVITGKRDGRYLVNDPYYGPGPYRRTSVAPSEVYGFHRWRGPVPANVAAASHVPQPAGPAEPVPVAAPILGARFVRDVTVPDGAAVASGTPLVKTWALRNTGNTAWEGVRLVHVGGDALGAAPAVEAHAEPGATAEISVELVVPGRPGRYVGRWQLEAADGRRFGPVIWVDLVAVQGG